jgi:hypothetical protein
MVRTGAAVLAALGVIGPAYAPPQNVLQLQNEGANASELGVGDVNNDGRPDIVITHLLFQNKGTFPVALALNDGHGGFTDGSSLFVGPAPRTQHARNIVFADFNRDGRTDFFIADHGYDADPYPGYQNTLVLSTPDGHLRDASANLPQRYDFTHSAAAADVDGNGTIDLVAMNLCCSGPGPDVLLNDGSGFFRSAQGRLGLAETDRGTHTYPTSRFADVDGNGTPDLILGADRQLSANAILLNDSSGHFTWTEPLPPKPFGPTSIALDIEPLDLDGDGATDLVITYTRGDPFYVGAYIQVVMNDGHGHFTDETATRLPQQPSGNDWVIRVQPIDLNGDGKIDLAARLSYGGHSSYLNDGTGHFALSENVLAPGMHAFVDVNGDGVPDAVTVEWGSPATDQIRVALAVFTPARPAAVRATKRGSPVRVTWTAVASAVSYEVWRSGKLIGTSTEAHFEDAAVERGHHYAYRVRAVNAAGTGPLSMFALGGA